MRQARRPPPTDIKIFKSKVGRRVWKLWNARLLMEAQLQVEVPRALSVTLTSVKTKVTR